jgi:hypothetical protein
MSLSIRKSWPRCSVDLFYQRRRCTIATASETIIGLRILNSGLVAGNPPELESAIW